MDTPGHKDFAEDTYCTLSAVDSVILVVDCVKGVEEQTRKLMEVCRMRNTPGEVVNLNPFKTKQLDKGVRQMTDEGVAQLFIQQPGNRKIIGTVGELQYEVIKFRLEHEYGAKCSFSPLPFIKACWLTTDNKKELKQFLSRKSGAIAYDKENNPVFLPRVNGC